MHLAAVPELSWHHPSPRLRLRGSGPRSCWEADNECRLPVDVPNRTFAANEICGGYSIVSTLVHSKSSARGRIRVIVVVLVETVPPVEMVLGKIRFA
jgi:hypothetical protein